MIRPKLFDCIIVLAIIAASAAFLFVFSNGENGKQVSVSCQGADLVFSLEEDCEKTITSKGYTLVIAVENGEAYVKEASCPDKYCEKSGRISKTGERIICAPAGVLIKIINKGENDEAAYDAVAG